MKPASTRSYVKPKAPHCMKTPLTHHAYRPKLAMAKAKLMTLIIQAIAAHASPAKR